MSERDSKLLFYREQLIYFLMQHIDGAILQGNRAIEASEAHARGEATNGNYTFKRERFELGLYLQCLLTVIFMVDDLRDNAVESGLRFDVLQPIKNTIKKSIDRKLLIRLRNAWLHPEKTLLGKTRDGNVSDDVVNDGMPLLFWMQVVNGEILASDKLCATRNERGEIIWLTREYISVQGTLKWLCEIREDVKAIGISMESYVKYPET